MEEIYKTRELSFTTPTGHHVTIREQNGADDDILSNPAEAATLMNLSRFVAGIILKSDYTEVNNGRLSPEQVHELPVLDRYCILFNSRIFSLGDAFEFEYDWGKNGGKVVYEQDLRDYLLNYYNITEEELAAKPNAIQAYPYGNKTKDLEITTSTGKELIFNLLTPKGETWFANLPQDKQTRNATLLARELKLKVNNSYELVTNFSSFTPREMGEIRQAVSKADPIFTGTTDIENPITKEVLQLPVVGIKDFFFLGEI